MTGSAWPGRLCTARAAGRGRGRGVPPGPARKTAVLAARLIRNHPLPDGNNRVRYLCALEFVARNGGTWAYPPDAPESDETVAIVEGVAAGDVDEDELCDWASRRLA